MSLEEGAVLHSIQFFTRLRTGVVFSSSFLLSVPLSLGLEVLFLFFSFFSYTFLYFPFQGIVLTYFWGFLFSFFLGGGPTLSSAGMMRKGLFFIGAR